jgi:diphthine synthase
MLYIIGIGLADAGDITVKGLDAARNSNNVYLDSYTSPLLFPLASLEKKLDRKIIRADRKMVEQEPEETILKGAKEGNNAFLVVGDALSATTHIDLMLRAQKLGIETEIIHNASILTAVAETGLQLYKFGKTASIPFPNDASSYLPNTPYDILKQNKSIEAHTLFLLDLHPAENKFMTVAEAVNYLLKIELTRGERVFLPETVCVACSCLGSKKQIIRVGKAKELVKDSFGKPPFCLIAPGKLHFMEEEALKRF